VDSLSLGDKAEEASIAVKAPWPPLFNDFDSGFIMPVQQFVGDASVR
jgi:hypothetical protein